MFTQFRRPKSISLIVLCYNHENFIREAIDSVLAQTYRPLEIVVIDDCSTDQSAERITDRLAAGGKGPEVRFIRNPQNRGGRASIEIGLGMTTSEFVIIVSGDDVLMPDMAAEMAKVWRGENVSLVTANASYIDHDSRPLGRNYRAPGASVDESFETLARDGANACCFGPAMGFERLIYTKFGWPPLYLGGFDIMLPFYAYLLKGARFIAKPLVRYRVHSANTSLSLIGEKQDDATRLMTQERAFYQHIAHALLMQQVLQEVTADEPGRYRELAARINPLLTIQIVEMAKKLVKTRIEMQVAGSKLGPEQFGMSPITK